MELLLLELFSILSLTMAILMIPFEVTPLEGILLLVFYMAVLWVFAKKGVRKKPWSLLLLPLFFLPLTMTYSMERLYFTLAFTGIMYVYYDGKLGELDPMDLALRFKVSYGLLLLFAGVSFLAEGLRWILYRNLPFLLLFFFSTIILSTSLRHQQAGIDPRKSRQKILVYLLMASIFSLVFGLEGLRGGFLSFMGIMGNWIFQGLYYVIYPVAYGVFYVLTRLGRFYGLGQFQGGQGGEPEDFTEDLEYTMHELRDHPVLNALMSFGVLVLVLYLLYRFFKGRKEKVVSGLAYEEEREFLKEKKRPRLLRRKEKIPKELRERMRYYYRQYLRSLKKELPISSSWTSEEIAKEASRKEPQEHSAIRSRYVAVRYGQEEVHEPMVEDFRRWVKEVEDRHEEK